MITITFFNSNEKNGKKNHTWNEERIQLPRNFKDTLKAFNDFKNKQKSV